MADKELRRLSRRELLEMLIEQEKENAHLRAALEDAEKRLESRELDMTRAGTLAEAALKLNGVFEAADAAVKQYTENIKRCNDRQQAEYDRIVRAAQVKANEILKKAEAEKAQTQKSTDDRWRQLSGRLESFYRSHKEFEGLVKTPSAAAKPAAPVKPAAPKAEAPKPANVTDPGKSAK